MLKQLLERIRLFFFSLNFFESGSTDEAVIVNERLSTRIYCILMLTLLVLVGSAGLIIERSISGYVSSPLPITFQSLSRSHASTLNCPCTQISIPYRSFARVEVELHQVCSSYFITDEWIRSISTDEDRLELSFFWQTIAGFCQLSRKSIEMIIEQFQRDTIITGLAMQENLLRAQTESAFNAILDNTRSAFFRNLLSLQRVIAGNQFVSGLGTNFVARWHLVQSAWEPSLFPVISGGCSCWNLDGCPRPLPFGMVSDCLTLNGALQSSLACYYNASCIAQLHPSASTINPLKNEREHPSTSNATIQDMLSKFLIDQRFISLDFTRYYRQCQPSYCSYTYRRRFDFLYAFTIILGVYSGLNIVLRLLVPLVIKKLSQRRRRLTIQNRDVGTQININQSFRVQAKNLFSTIRHSIVTMNLFGDRLTNAENIPRQYFMTRLFIFLLAGSVFNSGLYIFFTMQAELITVPRPSLQTYEKLYEEHTSTLTCPCSQISIPYEKFLYINYTLHQICSSTLVSSAWLQFTLDYNQSQFDGSPFSFIIDFRRIAPSYFQLLATVCSVVEETIRSSLTNLGKTHFVNKYVPSREEFLNQMFLLNDSVTNSIQREFINMQNWLRMATTQSHFLMGTTMSTRLEANPSTARIQIRDQTMALVGTVTETEVSIRGVCSCRLYPTACLVVPELPAITVGQSYPLRYLVGIDTGCIPWEGLLGTNTAWWYRTDILEQIRLLFGDHLRNESRPIISALDQQANTRFRSPNGDLFIFEDILKETLLEEWSGDLTRFDLFYQECAPTECTYAIRSRRSRFTASLLLISICGGLNRILRWFTFIFILTCLYIRDRLRHRREQGHWNILRNIRNSFTQLNLFQTNSLDPHDLQTQRRQTRIYLCLLFLCILIVLLYTSLEERAIVEVIASPTDANEYERFQRLYGNTLQCLCARTALDYSALIPVFNARSFHPVCKSIFVQEGWFEYFDPGPTDTSYIPDDDFRQWGAALFRLVGALCSLAENHLNQSLSIFFSSSFVTNRMLSQNEFEESINNTLDHLEQRIPAQFTQMIDIIRLISQGNGLISVFSTNWEYLVQNNNRTDRALLKQRPVSYNNATCSCALSAQCSMPATIYRRQGDVSGTMVGMRSSCTILESLIQSSLECFYSLSCINNLPDVLAANDPNFIFPYLFLPDSYQPIDGSGSTFSVNDTFDTIINRMFIEGWQREVSYRAFVDGCAPRECTYTRHQRFDAIDAFTTFLSVFGGLSVALRFFVPQMINFLMKIRRFNRVRHN